MGRLHNIPKRGVSEEMLGWPLTGPTESFDSSPEVLPQAYLVINGMHTNPSSCNYQKATIQTSISAINRSGLGFYVRCNIFMMFVGGGRGWALLITVLQVNTCRSLN